MILSVEIGFPVPIDLTSEQQHKLIEWCSEICTAYKTANPGRTMWPAGFGFKPTFIPMTREQEASRSPEFDRSTFQIEVFERADYEWPCSKCGCVQGDHKDHMIDPPAGDCEFTPAIKRTAP